MCYYLNFEGLAYLALIYGLYALAIYISLFHASTPNWAFSWMHPIRVAAADVSGIALSVVVVGVSLFLVYVRGPCEAGAEPDYTYEEIGPDLEGDLRLSRAPILPPRPSSIEDAGNSNLNSYGAIEKGVYNKSPTKTLPPTETDPLLPGQ